MGNFNRIILGFVLGLIPFISKAQSDPDWPRFELYQLVQGQDSGIFVITDSDSNLVFTDLLKMRFFPDTALIFNGDTIAVKTDLSFPTLVEGLGISIEYDQVLNQYYIESLSIEDTIHNGTASVINKGTPLYAAGIQGNYWSVAPADASDANKMPVVIIAGEDINPGEDGLGLIKGHIKQVSTIGLASGSEVYVAAGGGYTSVKPKGENNIIQRLGTVIKGNTNNGSGIINLGDPQESGNLNTNNIFIGASDSTVTTINLYKTVKDTIAVLVSDSLLYYATKIQLTDTALAIRTSIPLIVSDTATVLRSLIDTKGTVSSVAATGSNGISVTGSPITTTGTLAITSNATTLNNANTIVLRDGSGNFKAGTIEADLAGTANQVQSDLSPGYGLTPSDVYNGFFARTFNVDTSKLATLTAVKDTATAIRSAIGSSVTGSFISGAVPYSASGGSTLNNSGWYVISDNLIDRITTPSYKLDVNGSIGGTSLTSSGAVNGQTASFSRGATFNTDVGNYDFVVGGNALATLFRVKGSSLRVGINYGTDPGYTLDVNGDVNISSGSVYRINGTALTGSQWTTIGSDIYYNSGNVGIGMTNPTSTLHVTGTIKGTGNLDIDNGLLFVNTADNYVGINNNSPFFPLDVTGSARIDGSTFFVSSGDDRVGIGTGTPGYKLDVNGDVNVASGSNFKIGGVNLATTTINDNAAQRLITGSNTANTLNAQSNITWQSSYLDISGDVYTNNIRIRNSTTSALLEFNNSTTGNSFTDGLDMIMDGNNFIINNNENGYIKFQTNNLNDRLTIEGDGDIYVNSLGTNGTVYSNNNILTNVNPSDKRLKQNINQLKYGLNEINELNPVSFQYKDSKDKSIKFGYIAQEVKDVLPEAVQEQNDGYLGMFPDKIDVVAVKAIQELYEMVLMQKKEIEQMQQEIKRIKKNK